MSAVIAAAHERKWRRLTGTAAAAARVFRDTLHWRLPPRYQEPLRQPFDDELRRLFRPGMHILDAGAGRTPTIAVADRPSNCHYTGLDLSLEELQQAPPGSYHEIVVADVTELQDELRQRFDLVVSWQVLEHVKPLEQVVENLRSYLRPGGHLVIQFSGTFSLFAIVNRLVPRWLGVLIVRRLMHADVRTIYPARYHHCYDSKLRQMGSSWSAFTVVPRYLGGYYLTELRPLLAAYLAYEEVVARWPVANAASYYMVFACR